MKTEYYRIIKATKPWNEPTVFQLSKTGVTKEHLKGLTEGYIELPSPPYSYVNVISETPSTVIGTIRTTDKGQQRKRYTCMPY